MNCPVRIAVAGAGTIGQAHIKRILEEPGAELAAIIDPSPKAQEQASSLGVPCFADLAVGLWETGPDGVRYRHPQPTARPKRPCGRKGWRADAAGRSRFPVMLRERHAARRRSGGGGRGHSGGPPSPP